MMVVMVMTIMVMMVPSIRFFTSFFAYDRVISIPDVKDGNEYDGKEDWNDNDDDDDANDLILLIRHDDDEEEDSGGDMQSS